MLRLANSLMKLDSARGATVSPRMIALCSVALVVAVLATLFTKVFFVVLFGMIGITAGYALHNLRDDENPLPAVRPILGIRRLLAIVALSAVSMLIALALFVESIGAQDSGAFGKGALMCGAYAFFAFGVASYVFGRQALSRARRKLARASVEQMHIWRLEDDASRQKGDALS